MLKSLFDLSRYALLFAVAFVALSGWGAAVGRWLKIGWSRDAAREERAFTGLFCLFLWGGVWNFFRPFSLFGAFLFTAVGVIFYARHEKVPVRRRDWLLLPAALLFLSFAMGETQVADSLSYHCDAIRWINGFAAVPGLANLHSRLGFNQFYFFWPAYCEAWLPGIGWAAANPFLGMLTAAYLLDSRKTRPRRWLAALALGGIVAYSFRGFLASPAPDPGSTFLQTAFLAAFAWQLEEREKGRFPFFVLFAVTLVLTKLANAVTAGTALVILLAMEKEKFRALGAAALPALLLLGVWIARGVILSGYWFYPLLWPSCGVDWRLPASIALEEQISITGWARLPGEAYRSAVGSPWSTWLGSWLRLRGREMLTETLYFAVAMTAWCCWGDGKRRRRFLLTMLPAAAGVLFWFVTAPDPRFIRGILLFAAIVPAAFLLRRRRHRRTRFGAAALAAFLVFLPYPPSGNSLRHTLRGGAAPRPPVRAVVVQCRSGLWVTWTGIKGSPMLFLAPPLPATPQLNPGLSLRGKTLQEGFVLDATAKSSDERFLPDPQKRSNR